MGAIPQEFDDPRHEPPCRPGPVALPVEDRPRIAADSLPQVLPREPEVQPPFQEVFAEGTGMRRILRIKGFRASEDQLAERQRRGAHAAGSGIRSVGARARREMWSGTARACRGR